MREPFASVDDLEAFLGTDVDNAEAAEVLLRSASEIVRAFAGKDWLDDDGELDDAPEHLSDIVLVMVDRATQNPDGITQETIGAYSRSFGSDAAQRLYLTLSEKAVVRRAAGRSVLSTISTSRGAVETATPCSVIEDCA